jgi:hypothetical protein
MAQAIRHSTAVEYAFVVLPQLEWAPFPALGSLVSWNNIEVRANEPNGSGPTSANGEHEARPRLVPRSRNALALNEAARNVWRERLLDDVGRERLLWNEPHARRILELGRERNETPEHIEEARFVQSHGDHAASVSQPFARVDRAGTPSACTGCPSGRFPLPPKPPVFAPPMTPPASSRRKKAAASPAPKGARAVDSALFPGFCRD